MTGLVELQVGEVKQSTLRPITPSEISKMSTIRSYIPNPNFPPAHVFDFGLIIINTSL